MSKQTSNQGPNAKKTPFLEDLQKQVFGWTGQWKEKLSDFANNWEKIRDITKNNFELGKMHLQLGNLSDAVFRFRMVTWLEPKHTEAWFFLGASYMAEKKLKLARQALQKAVDLYPGYEEARYMLAIAKGKEAKGADLPNKMPLTLAKSHFDSVAADYTQEQIEVLGYEGHRLLTTDLRAHLIEDRLDYEILELGVGTGLCGPFVRSVASRLIGVDISAQMIAEAMKVQDGAGNKVYDALLNKEMVEFLRETPDEVTDIVMAGTVFTYVGDLSEAMKELLRVLRPGGLLAFTVDTTLGDGFRLDTVVGRFRFSEKYLKDIATQYGFTILQMEEVAAYPAYMMWLCVFAKQ